MRIKPLFIILFLSISWTISPASSIRINWQKATDQAKSVNRLGPVFGLVQRTVRYNKWLRMGYGKVRGGLGKLASSFKSSKITDDNIRRLKELHLAVSTVRKVDNLSLDEHKNLCKNVLEMQQIVSAISKELAKNKDYDASLKGGIAYYANDATKAKLVRDKAAADRYNDKRERVDYRDISIIRDSIDIYDDSIKNYENNSKKVGKKSLSNNSNVNLDSSVATLKSAMKDLEQVIAIRNSLEDRYTKIQCEQMFNKLREQAAGINNTEQKK